MDFFTPVFKTLSKYLKHIGRSAQYSLPFYDGKRSNEEYLTRKAKKLSLEDQILDTEFSSCSSP